MIYRPFKFALVNIWIVLWVIYYLFVIDGGVRRYNIDL